MYCFQNLVYDNIIKSYNELSTFFFLGGRVQYMNCKSGFHMWQKIKLNAWESNYLHITFIIISKMYYQISLSDHLFY